MSYLGRSAKLSLKAQEKVSFLATAGQTSKTGLSYTPTFVEVYVNGVLLTDTTDFTATNGNSVTFTVALLLNDEVTVVSLKTFTVADHYNKTEADTLLAAKATNTALALKAPIASPSFTGNVGIGDTTFAAGKLRVYDSSGNHVWLKGRASDGTSSVSFRNNADSAYNGRIQVADSGGMEIAVGGSERMRIDAAGIVTTPYQPAFKIQVGTASGGNLSASLVPYTSSTGQGNFNNGNHFDTSTSKFNAPTDGYYLFAANVRADNFSDNSGYLYLDLKVDGVNVARCLAVDGGSYVDRQITAVVKMQENDAAHMELNSVGDTNVTMQTDSWFSGHLIG